MQPARVGSVVTAVVCVPLAALLVGACGQRGAQSPPSATAAKTPPGPVDLTARLESGITATGSANFAMRSKAMVAGGTETWGEWSFDITLENHTDTALTLDGTMALVESDPKDLSYDGYLLVRKTRVRKMQIPPVTVQESGKQFDDPAISYAVEEYSGCGGGARYTVIGSLKIKFHSTASPDPECDRHDALVNGKPVRLRETIEPYQWLTGKNRASVSVVLPELHAGTGDMMDSYQPVVRMARGADVDAWKTKRLVILHETPAALEAVLTSSDDDLFTRVLAANRLAEYFPQQAAEAFHRTSELLREGQLLACMIDLGARMKTTALDERCRALATDKNVPKGISSRARAYLATIGTGAK